jgi:hypothetical protein
VSPKNAAARRCGRKHDGGIREELAAGVKDMDRLAGGSIQNGPRRLRPIKGLQWQTLVRGDIGRQRLFRPLANPGEVEASCVFRARMRHEVKQHDFKMFEGDS